MVKIGDIEILKSMLQSSPNLLYTKNEQGMTALHIAVSCGLRDIIELLEKEGLKIDEKTLHGSTHLSLAAKNHHTLTVQFLQTKLAPSPLSASTTPSVSNINPVSSNIQSNVSFSLNNNIPKNIIANSQEINKINVNSNNPLLRFQHPVQPIPNSNMNPTPTTQYNPSSFSNNNTQSNLQKQIHSLIKAHNDQSQLITQQKLEILQLKAKLEFAEQLINKYMNNVPSLHQTQNPEVNNNTTITTNYVTTPLLTQVNNNISQGVSNNEMTANIEPLEVIATLATIKSETPNLTFQEQENRKRSANSSEIGNNKNSRTS